MRTSCVKNGLVVGVILLFVGVSITPSINANVDRRFSKLFTNPIFDETVEITVSRYKADSTVEKIKVILSKEKALEFKERYRNTDDSEKRFSLLKEYGLIPEDVTREHLRQEMLNLAEELGLTDEKIDSISERFTNKRNSDRLIGINFLNLVVGFSFCSLNLPIGLSFITGLLNYFVELSELWSIDLLYFTFCFCGIYGFVFGILPDLLIFIVGFFALLGFIGFVISIPLVSPMSVLEGFTVASLVIPGRTSPP